jgi:hypothetical protein
MISRHRWGAALLAAGLAFGLFSAGGAAASRTQEGGGDALSVTFDAGRVLDCEGSVARKAVLAARWSGLKAGSPVVPGDWLEVGQRGANALKLRLASGAQLVLGPGSLVEVVDAATLRLSRGELLVDASGVEEEIVVEGPDTESLRIDGRVVLRAKGRELSRLQDDPRWLVGYQSNASTEALGSLLANVDGRNIPLTIGYHKVTVDVRDQIARTVIEESFVNHTSTILEGVFYFPLPAGSSISGFGMWIGNELVQGVIVV